MRAFALVLALGCGAAVAEGPGTRLRASDFPAPPSRIEQERMKLCQGLKPQEQRRCLREARTADEPGKLSGPESTGTPSGAGAGATAGAGAPR